MAFKRHARYAIEAMIVFSRMLLESGVEESYKKDRRQYAGPPSGILAATGTLISYCGSLPAQREVHWHDAVDLDRLAVLHRGAELPLFQHLASSRVIEFAVAAAALYFHR
jgi:hypothetical protein